MAGGVIGFREAAQDLRAAAQRLEDRAKVRSALWSASEPVLHRAQANIPKKTGKTAAQIAIVDAPAPPGVVRLAIGIRGPRGFIGRLLEYGTSRMAARPWMRPANDTDGGQVLVSRFVVALREIIGPIFRSKAA